MKNITYSIIFWGILCLGALNSCKKFIDAKPDQKLSTVNSLADLQALLDNLGVNNAGTRGVHEQSDEYYLLESGYNSRSELVRQSYIWHPQIQNSSDWDRLYYSVFQSNTVLDHLKEISLNGQLDLWNSIKGQALFFRAYHFFQVAQLYAPQYDKNTASGDWGIPLRLNSNFNEPTTRSTVQQTYDQIIEDLNLAATLLSPNITPITPLTKCRPGLAAVYGLLARVYLQMNDYPKAKDNANLCLQQHKVLREYNDYIGSLYSTAVVFKLFEPEVIFYSSETNAVNGLSAARVDSNLYRLFDSSDIRKYVFFRKNSDGTYRFKGTYNELIFDKFSGIATDEIYLIRAECFARESNVASAKNDLDTLLIKRYMNTVSYNPVTANTAEEALNRVLLERRKELIYRGTRWSDLRRLNKDNRFATTLKRVIGSQTYTLPPNDLKYTLLIPQNVINLTGIQQNAR